MLGSGKVWKMWDDDAGDRRGGAGSPDLLRVRDRADLVRELGLLRSCAARGSGRARVSLEWIAAATGVPRSTVHAYLRGQRVPPPDVLDAIVLALGVSGAEAREWAGALYRVVAAEAAGPAAKSRGGETPARGRRVPRQLPAAVALVAPALWAVG
jgi:transcriptional regulator with XRE-family HTH domain